MSDSPEVTAGSAQTKLHRGDKLTSQELHALHGLSSDLDQHDSRLKGTPHTTESIPLENSTQHNIQKAFDDSKRNSQAERKQTDGTPNGQSEETKKLIDKQIHQASIMELNSMLYEGIISQDQLDAELKLRPGDDTFTFAKSATGVPVEYRNFTSSDAEQWIKNNIPRGQQANLLTELKNFRDEGGNYSVSIGRDGRGYRMVKFKSREAAQSVTREIRRETGKQINRLINPDYAHNEMMREYKLVREALPEGTATRQMLEKTDKVVSAVLTASGITAEAANLLLNAIRGALLEAPELRYKVAALLPDDVVRQGYVVAARSAGNTLRRYIHEKYHLPDRPKQTPVLVNTLDQIKPEHYRAQDPQKVGVDMRDLNREKAREFILNNVPVEKQASALETIDRLPGNTFGVQIMDSGWVRISASAREPRSYDNRPRYGSYDATKMP